MFLLFVDFLVTRGQCHRNIDEESFNCSNITPMTIQDCRKCGSTNCIIEQNVTTNELHLVNFLNRAVIIVISNSELKNISENFLPKLGKLVELKLTYDQIEEIHKKALHGLKHLRNLDLNNNHIRHID